MNEAKIRVLVADDSALMRRLLGDILSSDPRIEVVGTAKDGADALEKAAALSPDVLTLDVEMPQKNGLEVLETLMKTNPIPVIMISAQTQEGAQTTFKALSLGCVDFVEKPSGTISLDIGKVAEELISKVVMAKNARVHPLQKKNGEPPAGKNAPFAPAASRPKAGRREIVAVASSTGGPRALQHLLSKLPGDFPVPIVITQHMPKDFTASFAKRLDAVSAISVTEGEEGMQLQPGLAVVAPGDHHLVVKKRAPGMFCCGLSDAPPVLSVRPAANIMFQSVADEFGGKVVGIVLTGMGRDGADGAIALHAKGAYIIAESQETCVVYGMSKAAVETGAVDEILPLYDIPDALLRSVK
jgi:two-component system chemotaxis response regulator CheB